MPHLPPDLNVLHLVLADMTAINQGMNDLRNVVAEATDWAVDVSYKLMATLAYYVFLARLLKK